MFNAQQRGNQMTESQKQGMIRFHERAAAAYARFGQTKKAEQAKADAERKQREQEQEYQRRIDTMIGLGFRMGEYQFVFAWGNTNYMACSYTFQYIRTIANDDWAKFFGDVTNETTAIKDKAKAEADRIAAEKESAKPEIEKAREYIQSILYIPVPKCQISNIVSILSDFEEEMTLAARRAMNDLDKI
jgi:hypothetical protein